MWLDNYISDDTEEERKTMLDKLMEEEQNEENKKEVRKMEKSIYHATDKEGGYKALNLKKDENGRILISVARGVKGQKDSREYINMALSEDEAAGLMVWLQKALLR